LIETAESQISGKLRNNRGETGRALDIKAANRLSQHYTAIAEELWTNLGSFLWLRRATSPLRGASALACADRFAGGQHAARNPCSTVAAHPENLQVISARDLIVYYASATPVSVAGSASLL
jgi:hypothetical protein